MKTIETINLEGIFSIWKTFSDGRKYLVFHDKNLITLAARQALLSYLYTTVTTDPINGLKVGTGGCIDPEGLFPKQENPAWTTLNTTLTTVGTGGLLTIGQTIDNTVPQITYLADLDQATGNGVSINEAGLFKASGAMFNVKTFPSIPKTSEFNLHIEWVIKWA